MTHDGSCRSCRISLRARVGTILKTRHDLTCVMEGGRPC